MSSSLAARFHERFEGLDRAYGVYETDESKKVDGKKFLGKPKTVRGEFTLALWERHLAGKATVGVIPIRDDNTAVFGAIDVDEYPLDHVALSQKIEAAELPLIVCRSKSGGAHLYVFCREPVPAELIRNKLMEWAVFLGRSGVEVFPKQTRLANERDVGNWINMPYFGAVSAKGKKKDRGDRFAYQNGEPLTAEQFLDFASDIAQTHESLRTFRLPESSEVERELLHEAPPCLQVLANQGGISKGGRNNGLFSVGVYLRKRFGDEDWVDHLDEYNQRLIVPPLGHREVDQVKKSVNRKAYEYKCKDTPICDACNKQICLSREYGVGTGPGDPGVLFGQLVKVETDPPTWIWEVNGKRIELTTAQIKDQGRFHTRCIEELNIWPLPVKPQEWSRLVRHHLESAEVMDVPLNAKPQGQMWYYLEQYCTQQTRARNKDQLLQHKPWTDHEEGRVYFHGPHFHQYLGRQGIKVAAKVLWNWLRDGPRGDGEGGAQTHFLNIKGKGINIWSVAAFDEQTEGFEIPIIANQEEM